MASVINGTNIVLYKYDSNKQYYFNGSINQGVTVNGFACKELSTEDIVGTSTNFTKTGAGVIASFITDANDPNITELTAGTWSISAYYSIATAFAGAKVQYKLYKYAGTTATLLATSDETTLTSLSKTLYSTNMTISTTVLASTDRIIIEVNYLGTTTNEITLYTQSTNPGTVTTNISIGVPFGASTNCTFSTSVDQVEVTTTNSESYKEFLGSQISWNISADGFIALSDYSYLFLLNKLQTKEQIIVKFQIDNDNGDGSSTLGYSIFTGLANIVNLDMSGPVEGASTYSVSLQGTGPYTVSGTQVTPTGVVIESSNVTMQQYTAFGGETTITFSTQIGSTCLSVTRGGIEVRTILTSGAPTGENVTFNSSTGVLTFARALEADEFVRAIFK
jgi:predicted secreted protein